MTRLGLVGLPNAGKSTLFNALTCAGAEVAPYPFTTIDRNVGTVAVPDARLYDLARLLRPPRAVPATVEFVDIAGLVRGAHRGEGLGNRFLAHIREVDALVHVVRCHEAGGVGHVEGGVDPVRDVGLIETELLLADLETVERRRAETARKAKSGERALLDELAALDALLDALGRGRPARSLGLDTLPEALRAQLFLLSDKPVLYLGNVDEAHAADPSAAGHARALADLAAGRDAPAVFLSARLEAELAELRPDEAAQLRAAYGLGGRALDRLIQAGYGLLGLITFFTFNENEGRAWPLPRGLTAWHAAGRIHTDLQQGFVRAEVVHCGDLLAAGGMTAARERGLVRSEGRDYVVRDGDLLQIRFTA